MANGKLLLKSASRTRFTSARRPNSSSRPTTNKYPNVGGFGQAETEIVLQNPARVQGLIVFLGTIFLTQIFLVLKRNKLKSSII
jgi:apocytochrome f